MRAMRRPFHGLINEQELEVAFVLINTIEGHQKLRNVRRDPRIIIGVVDPAHWEHTTSIRGRVVDIPRDGADLQFQQLIRRSLEHEEYHYGRPDQVRVLLKIAPEKIRERGSLLRGLFLCCSFACSSLRSLWGEPILGEAMQAGMGMSPKERSALT
jgi:hypothetical protein